MPYYRVTRMGCGGLFVRVVLLAMMGILALVCIGNRSWIEHQAADAIYGDRLAIHAGSSFRPGVSAVEDGVRQTAVLVGGTPHVQVTSPTADWLKAHKDAVCEHKVCTAAATRKSLPGSGGGLAFGSLAGMALFAYMVWTLLVGDDTR